MTAWLRRRTWDLRTRLFDLVEYWFDRQRISWIIKVRKWLKYWAHYFHQFCLRPSAIGQGIAWVVVLLVVVLHLVHFLIKRNLREKFLPGPDLNLGPPDPQSGTLPTDLGRHCCKGVWKLSTYFRPWTSIGRHLLFVRTGKLAERLTLTYQTKLFWASAELHYLTEGQVTVPPHPSPARVCRACKVLRGSTYWTRMKWDTTTSQ